MTVETFPQFAQIEIETIGPHEIPFPYEEGSIRCYVIADGRHVALADDDFTPSPASSTTLGTLYLSVNAFDDHFGRVLVIARETLEEQAWLGVMGGREKGLERQLDRNMMRAQELGRHVGGALRVFGAVDPIVPVPDAVVAFGPDGQPVAGPTVAEIAAAEQNGQIAQAGAIRAELAADAAEQWAAVPRAGVSNFDTLDDFKTYISLFDIWAVGDEVRAGPYQLKKFAGDGANYWAVVATVTYDPRERYIGRAEGAVDLRFLQPGAARTVIGNPKASKGPPRHIGMEEFRAMIGFAYYGETGSGGVDLPESTDPAAAPTALRCGTFTTLTTGLRTVTYAAPFEASQPIVLPAIYDGAADTDYRIRIVNRTATGFDCEVHAGGARVAVTMGYFAMGNGN